MHSCKFWQQPLSPFPSVPSGGKVYSRIHIRIHHSVHAIRIVFVTWCIRSSPSMDSPLLLNASREVNTYFMVITKHVRSMEILATLRLMGRESVIIATNELLIEYIIRFR